MADIDTVLERLVTDQKFRKQLGKDAGKALSGYDLSAADLTMLAGSLDDGDSAQRGVEQRTSKSAVLGLLASLSGGGVGGGPVDASSGDGAGAQTPKLMIGGEDSKAGAAVDYFSPETPGADSAPTPEIAPDEVLRDKIGGDGTAAIIGPESDAAGTWFKSPADDLAGMKAGDTAPAEGFEQWSEPGDKSALDKIDPVAGNLAPKGSGDAADPLAGKYVGDINVDDSNTVKAPGGEAEVSGNFVPDGPADVNGDGADPAGLMSLLTPKDDAKAADFLTIEDA